jgi:hypothetical protein
MSLDYEVYIQVEINNWLFEENQIVKNLINYLNLSIDDVFSIKAHKNIKLFENRGKPKTDLIVELLTKSGTEHILTISIKKTSKKKSSFHEYSVEDFIKVLQINDNKIIDILYKHQNDGSSKYFTLEERTQLTQFFNQENKKRLYDWVLTGKGGKGEGTQIANCILKNDKFYSIDDYIKEFLSSNAGFGTGFSWTRQSRGKGRTIQLKG